MDADVCIVGAGYTGLWAAWSLKRLDPSLRVCVVESRTAGFGASGRNGGWLSGLMPGNRALMARGPAGRSGIVAMQRALVDAVTEIERTCDEERIEADLVHGGTLAVAVNASQMRRLASSVEEDRSWGLGEADVRLLDAAEVASRVRVDATVGGVFSPHCARVQPAKLVSGLAAAVARSGAQIFERSPAVRLGRGSVLCSNGEVRAPWIVQATEGFTSRMHGQRRRLLPMNSSIVVTEPLPQSAWSDIGWAACETLRDSAHGYVYLQRTADGRIAIGGRGNPYRFGSRFDPSGFTPAKTVEELTAAARRMFPVLSAVRPERAWSGVLGVARDWCPFIEVSRSGAGDGGTVRAGGYVGDGVTTSFLAGRTVADLVLGRSTELTALPWVGHTSRRWEPEPLRWLGVHALYRAYRRADRVEAGRPDDPRTSRWAAAADRISGRA